MLGEETEKNIERKRNSLVFVQREKDRNKQGGRKNLKMVEKKKKGGGEKRK